MGHHGYGTPNFGWDLPPGCRDSDIPGNSPEDEAWEAACEKASEEWDDLTEEELDDAGKEDEWIENRAKELLEEWAEAKADAQLSRWENERDDS